MNNEIAAAAAALLPGISQVLNVWFGEGISVSASVGSCRDPEQGLLTGYSVRLSLSSCFIFKLTRVYLYAII